MSAITNLDTILKSSGIPIHGVALLADNSIRVDYKDEITDEQKVLAESIVSGWDANIAQQQVEDRKIVVARHLMEAETGVVLSNGMRMRYADAAISNYSRFMTVLNVATTNNVPIEGVVFYDANDKKYTIASSGADLTPSQAMGILSEYTFLAAKEVCRQLEEISQVGGIG